MPAEQMYCLLPTRTPSHTHTHIQMLGRHSDVDPEVLFTKQERIGKGSFGEVYKG